MEKKAYSSPDIKMVEIAVHHILTGTTETLPFDPGTGTDDAFSKEINENFEDFNPELENLNNNNTWSLW